MTRRRLVAVLAAALAFALIAVPAASARRSAGPLTIFAASSLNLVLPQIDSTPKYSFAGSDALQAQIALGAPAGPVPRREHDRTRRACYASGKCQNPVVFIANRLALAVPSANPKGIESIYDLEQPGVKVLIGGIRRCRWACTRARSCGISGC